MVIGVMEEEAGDEKVGALTHALPSGKQLSTMCKVSHVCEAVDAEKWVGPQQRKFTL